MKIDLMEGCFERPLQKGHQIYIFEEAGQKVVIYDVMGFGAEDTRCFLGGIMTIFY